MTNLHLSDAVRLGSFLVADPAAGDVERCAITMVLKAIGALPENLYDCRSYRGDLCNQWNTLAYPELTLRGAYPWIDGTFLCRWCGEELTGECVVWHPFDWHVMHGPVPLDDFCHWLQFIDPMHVGSEAGAATGLLKSYADLKRGPSLVPIAK
jgi:hypothetical protein